MSPILRSRRCSTRLLVASATPTNQKYAPIDFRINLKGSRKAAKPGKTTSFCSQIHVANHFCYDSANIVIPPPIVEVPIVEVPIEPPRIPIIPAMPPPGVINSVIEQSTTTAVEPALASAIGPTALHPIQPIPRSLPHPICTLKQNRRPKSTSNTDRLSLKQSSSNKKFWYCYTPERQLIPNSVIPSEMPKGISEYNYKNNLNNRNAFFQVCYDNTCIRYTYGANGYTRENAYMEAARCLRYFLIRTISKLDNTMDINHDMYDTLDVLLSDYDGLTLERTLSLATATTTTTSSSVVYDMDDNLDVDFGNFDDLPYTTTHTSSMDVEPLVVNFDDDLDIEI